MRLTFTRTVGSAEYGALFYCAERREELADILLSLLFAEHAHEQLPICDEKHMVRTLKVHH